MVLYPLCEHIRFNRDACLRSTRAPPPHPQCVHATTKCASVAYKSIYHHTAGSARRVSACCGICIMQHVPRPDRRRIRIVLGHHTPSRSADCISHNKRINVTLVSTHTHYIYAHNVKCSTDTEEHPDGCINGVMASEVSPLDSYNT